jgi:GMP synthase (glutamine-hydrolysing)
MAASRTCLVVGHVAFEDLDLLAPIIAERGYEIRYLQAGVDRIETADVKAPELLVVLGGPIGVYETDTYPFIRDEIAAIRARLDTDKPMLGICLGAQLMAAALGARVAPGPVKEIGWTPVTLTEAGKQSVLATLATTPVLHWHGDNCELPAGCERLASTEHCPVQAFRRARSECIANSSTHARRGHRAGRPRRVLVVAPIDRRSGGMTSRTEFSQLGGHRCQRACCR